MLQKCLIWLILSFFEEARGQSVITQTPASLQANLADRVSIQCKASSSMGDDMALYQFKPGQRPKLLIHNATSHFEGTPDRFSRTYGNTDFSFTISDVHAEDEGIYFCAQDYSFPLVFGDGTNLEIRRREDSTPSALIFPPSPEQRKTDSATAACLVNTFYPSSLAVAWKVDGTPVTEGVQTSPPASNTDNTYKLTSTLTLPTSDFNAHELYSCEVTHKTLSSPLVKSFRRSELSG